MSRGIKKCGRQIKVGRNLLQFALKLNDETIKGFFILRFILIAKCYEDMNDMELARSNYQTALSFPISFLTMVMVK